MMPIIVKKTLKHGPLVASGPLFLLFLATVMITLQRTGASTSSDLCSAEYAACDNDEECDECISDWLFVDGGADALNECLENFSALDPAEDVCTSLFAGQPCCYDALSANDCLANSAFVEYWVCLMDYFLEGECTAASLNCPEGIGSEVVPDGTDDEADDDASVIGDDAPVADDDAGGVIVGDDAAGYDSSTSSSWCPAETTACDNNPECYECMTEWALRDDAGEALSECVENSYDHEVQVCVGWAATPCCIDSMSSNDCLGNSAFVDFWECYVSYLSDAAGMDEECTLTSPEGIGSGVVSDGSGEADDDADVTGDDAPASDDDAGGVVGDDAAGDDAGTTIADDDVTTSVDRGVDVADDDATVADDDAGGDAGAAVGGTTSSQSTLGEGGDSSGVVASSTPSVILAVFLGLGVVAVAVSL
eukprot:g6413.t1